MKENIQEIIEKYELKSGKHNSFEEGSCVMELVSYIANEPWSDHPKCACPILTKFAISFNDNVNDEDRQKLKAVIPKLLNSRNPEKVKPRGEFLALQSITVFLPMLTEALGLAEITEKLRSFECGQWDEAKKYIDSATPQIRAAEAAAAAAAEAAAAWAAEAAAAAAAWAAAEDPSKEAFWLEVKTKIIDAGIKALSDAADL